MKKIIHPETIESKILLIRGRRVILDAELAKIYDVPTKRLNEQVNRNLKRFPADFVFRLNQKETSGLLRSRSQFATLNRGQNIKYLPYAFTEHGAVMAANVLNSPQAVRMSVFVVRAFIRMRQAMSGNRELAKKLAQLEKMLTVRLDVHEKAIFETLKQLARLLDPEVAIPGPAAEDPPKKIGFTAGEKRAGDDASLHPLILHMLAVAAVAEAVLMREPAVTRESIAAALEKGIGHGKTMGLGLLSIAPVL